MKMLKQYVAMFQRIGAPDNVQVEDAQTWEDAGLENPFSPASVVQSPTAMESEQGGGVPMTPATDVHSDDEEVEIPSSSTKHTAGGPLPGECLKAQKMDDDPVPMPKVKASRTEDNVNQVAEIDMCHNILKTMRWKLILKMNALLVMGKVMVHPWCQFREATGAWRKGSTWRGWEVV